MSILSDDSANGDALSTTCLLLGREKGLALIESLPGVEALFIDNDGTMTPSSGFDAYRAEFPQHMLYPFMLDASVPLAEGVARKKAPFSLIMGNEGSGLPPEFAACGQPVRIPHSSEIDSLNLSVAAAIGMYAFAQKE